MDEDIEQGVYDLIEEIDNVVYDLKDIEFEEQEYCIELLQEIKRTCQMWLDEGGKYYDFQDQEDDFL